MNITTISEKEIIQLGKKQMGNVRHKERQLRKDFIYVPNVTQFG